MGTPSRRSTEEALRPLPGMEGLAIPGSLRSPPGDAVSAGGRFARVALLLTVVERVSVVLLLLYVFLIGVNAMGSGFKLLGKDVLDAFFMATANPFVGLVVGILGTSLVQSSSVTTAMVVAMVAAPEHPLPVANAVPIVMGANIGTTVTNTLVSLGHIARKEEFKRAFSVATCHDFFNFMAVALLLPLEIATGFLQRTAHFLSSVIAGRGGVEYESPLKAAFKVGAAPLHGVAGWVTAAPMGQAAVTIALSAAIIFLALFFLVRVLQGVMGTRVEVYVTRALDVNAAAAMLAGAVITACVQSSSITTSLLVPLAGAGIVTLRQAFPITLGANVGTTVTALLASLAVTGPNAEAGVTIALVHLLFNGFGILLVYPIEAVRRLPLRAARRLARLAVHSRRWAVAYVILLFYGLPALLVYVHKLWS